MKTPESLVNIPGSYERLENTMGAFEHAVNHCQTDMLEIDVQLTADKQVSQPYRASDF